MKTIEKAKNELKKQAKKLEKKGLPYYKIAERLGIGTTTAYSYCHDKKQLEYQNKYLKQKGKKRTQQQYYNILIGATDKETRKLLKDIEFEQIIINPKIMAERLAK
ncbi:MAG: hypothetical protein SVO01_06480 [Thermotogota bacterium]|nr:hypothetical protein [Thermotogota bacterium]